MIAAVIAITTTATTIVEKAVEAAAVVEVVMMGAVAIGTTIVAGINGDRAAPVVAKVATKAETNGLVDNLPQRIKISNVDGVQEGIEISNKRCMMVLWHHYSNPKTTGSQRKTFLLWLLLKRKSSPF
jgi:hypothetical protein